MQNLRRSLPLNSVMKIAVILFLSSFVLPALAEEESPKPKPPPQTTSNPEISIKELNYRLVPLTKGELEIEAEGWLSLLKDQAAKISQVQIEAMSAEGETKNKLLADVTKLKEQQTALMDRMRAVLEELESKGGEVETYDKYLTAVSGIEVDVTDAGGTWAVVTGWLTSKEGGLRWAKNFALFILTIVAFLILAKILGSASRRAVANFKGSSKLLKDFVVNVVSKATLLIGLIVALSMLEINVGPFLAAIGAAGFILGFALQGTLSNFAAGLMILLYRPYDVGDFVNVAGTNGTVTNMTLVSTTLTLPDNQTVIIPNGSIWGGIITNVTGVKTRRIDMTFGISYEDDMSKAQAVLEEIVKAHPLVLKTPEPVVRVHELADSSVNFVCRPWVNTSDYWTVYWDITRQVKEEFDRQEISIPFPQREVHVRQQITPAQQIEAA